MWLFKLWLCNKTCVLRLCILEKLKLNSGTGLIIIKANIELSKKEIKKSSQKLFQKHYCLDDHTVIGDCGFLLLKDVKCISAWKKGICFDNIDLQLFSYQTLMRKCNTHINIMKRITRSLNMFVKQRRNSVVTILLYLH